MTDPIVIKTNEDLEKLQQRELPHRPKGLPSPEEHHGEVMDLKYNLGSNKAVLGTLDYKAERVKELEKHIEKITNQYREEVEQLKGMLRKIGEENLRLKKLLKEYGVDLNE